MLLTLLTGSTSGIALCSDLSKRAPATLLHDLLAAVLVRVDVQLAAT
jgi:hypothetical protein